MPLQFGSNKKAGLPCMTLTLVIFGSPAFPWGSSNFRPYLAIGLALVSNLKINYLVFSNVSTEYFSQLILIGRLHWNDFSGTGSADLLIDIQASKRAKSKPSFFY
jgi:hypothetical protein